MAMTRELSTTRALASIQHCRSNQAGCRNRLISSAPASTLGARAIRLDEFGAPMFPIVS